MRRWPRRKRFLFFRFAFLFGFILLFFIGGIAIITLLLASLFSDTARLYTWAWIAGLVILFGISVVISVLIRRALRNITTPLSDLMSAADAVAAGDLSVRLKVKGPGEFSRLAESFNHMVAELERADQQRRNLTADVAHELRTPLQIIQGNLEGIIDEVYEPTEEHITVTLEETRLLTRLVDDLGTLSLAESGQLSLNMEPVDLRELLEDVYTSFSGQAEAKGIKLGIKDTIDKQTAEETKDTHTPARLMVTADAGRLDQVLGNLVANALQHTPKGGVITLAATPTPGGVRILVQDTGKGIAENDLPFVFDRFWRGDRSRTHAGGAGSGLGLAIAQQLVQAHGGQINIQSQKGSGTTFLIDLPGNSSQDSTH
jgi:two-component system OmpR family sensor kinase/two-component system sensor histidine kinase BaeS